MHFYSQTYPSVLALPVKTFWLMNGNIDRIQAQKDMRTLTVTSAAQSPGEAAKELRQRLIVEAGTIVKVEGDSVATGGRPYVHEERDEAGFAELKELSKLI
jgi:hypothetical protein